MSDKGDGMQLPAVVFVIFLILKLIGTITWSWWWVFSPLWIVVAFWLIVYIIIEIFWK